MIRQYHAAGRRRGGHNPLGLGVVDVGAIFHLQDEDWFRDRWRGAPVRRAPWIVEGFLNGTVGAGRRNRDTGFWENVTISGRSDTAVVRSLRDGRRRTISVQLLQLHDDLTLTKLPTDYPTLPDMRLYCMARHHRPRCAA